MLEQSKAFSSFSVNNVAKARDFYENILGLKVSENEMGILMLHLTRDNDVIIYPKGEVHVPANFTVLNFPVTNIDLVVKKLSEKVLNLNIIKLLKQIVRAFIAVRKMEMDPTLLGSKILLQIFVQ